MIPGIEVSKWQAEINWGKVKHAGVRFAFIKATQCISHTAPYFSANWQSARTVGLLCGAYHYFHPRLDARIQAQAFSRALAEDCGELPPAVDLEAPELSGPALMKSLATILQELEMLTSFSAIIFTSPGIWSSNTTPFPPEWPANHPLWIAHYGMGCPSIPYPWLTFSFWQFTDRAEVAGITRFPGCRPKVDLNWVNGLNSELDGLRIA